MFNVDVLEYNESGCTLLGEKSNTAYKYIERLLIIGPPALNDDSANEANGQKEPMEKSNTNQQISYPPLWENIEEMVKQG